MKPRLPGVDVKFLANVVGRLSERRLHTYYPGSRRSAAALILRFDEATQRALTDALATFQAVHRPNASSEPAEGSHRQASGTMTPPLDPVAFVHYMQDHCVDAAAPSALQLLFLKRADMDASRWSGQVAFPGGRRDPEDADDFATVCRETFEELGLPLQHGRDFICLGRLPDYRLRSRAVTAMGVVQARFVFLHVGDMTPSVQIATHAVASARWMPLRRLTAAHVEHGCVAHPLQTFVHPQDADYRLLLTELFPSTYLTFPSVSLPLTAAEEHSDLYTVNHNNSLNNNSHSDESSASGSSSDRASASSSSSRSWRVWGLTLRSANELLALDNRQPFDWPLVGSNSRVLQYCVLFPFHGYYELLYQYYLARARFGAHRRAYLRRRMQSPSKSGEGGDVSGERAKREERDRRVLYGTAMERRYAALPVSADALLFAAPEQPVTEHVVSLLALVALIVVLFYTVASIIADLFASVGKAFSVEAVLEREERRRAYYDANVHNNPNQSPSSQHSRYDNAGSGEMNEKEYSGNSKKPHDEDRVMADGIEVRKATDDSAAGDLNTPHNGADRTTQRQDVTSSFSSSAPASWWSREHRHRQGTAADEAALAAELRSDETISQPPPSATPVHTPAVAQAISPSFDHSDLQKKEEPNPEPEATKSILFENLREKSSEAPASAVSQKGKEEGVASPPPSYVEAARSKTALTDKHNEVKRPDEVAHADVIAKPFADSVPTTSASAMEVAEMSYDDALQAVMDRYRSG